MSLDPQVYIPHHLTNLTYGKLPAGYVRQDYDGNSVELLIYMDYCPNQPRSQRHGLYGLPLGLLSLVFGMGLVFSLLFFIAAQGHLGRAWCSAKLGWKPSCWVDGLVKKPSTAAVL